MQRPLTLAAREQIIPARYDDHIEDLSMRFRIHSFRVFCCLLLVALPIVVSRADVITPTGIKATSEWGLGIFAESLINGSGLMDFEETPDNVLDDLHDNSPTWENGWHSGDMDLGIPGGTDDDGDLFTTGLVDEQILEFDLGQVYNVTHAHIWQQNQSGLGVFLAPDRGVEEFELQVSTTADGDDFEGVELVGLEFEEGIEEVPAQVIEFAEAFQARRIRFDINSAFSGNENEFVGLGEVRFEGSLIGMLTPGDFNGDSVLDALDIDALTEAVLSGGDDTKFDLDNDGRITDDDRFVWVEDLKGTYFGDSNLDGEFSSTDFVVVFTAREYEDSIEKNSTWATGDWNGDGEFNSTDFVRAFTTGGYEQGPRPAVQTVPEPSGIMAMVLVMLLTLSNTRKRV